MSAPPVLRDYGWRVGAPNLLDLFIDSPAGASVLVVQAAIGGVWADLYRGVPDPSLLLVLPSQPEPGGGLPLETERIVVPPEQVLTEGDQPLLTEDTSLRIFAGFSSFGVTDYGPVAEYNLIENGGTAGPGNPVINSATFPASLTARINAVIQFQSRLAGYFEWPSAAGGGLVKHPATTVVTANVDFDTVLPESARGQVVTYRYWAIKGPKDVSPHDINTGFAPASVVLGVCP